MRDFSYYSNNRSFSERSSDDSPVFNTRQYHDNHSTNSASPTWCVHSDNSSMWCDHPVRIYACFTDCVCAHTRVCGLRGRVRVRLSAVYGISLSLERAEGDCPVARLTMRGSLYYIHALAQEKADQARHTRPQIASGQLERRASAGRRPPRRTRPKAVRRCSSSLGAQKSESAALPGLPRSRPTSRPQPKATREFSPSSLR